MKLKEKSEAAKEYIKTTVLYEFFIDSKNYYSKYRYIPWLFVIVVCSVALLLVPVFNKKTHENTQTESITTDEDNILSLPIYVTISGEVQKPGMYEMTEDSRIDDLIETAGGLTENAYVENINLAQKLTDEQYIKILSEDEAKTQTHSSSSASEAALADIININTATSEELCKLPSIGEVTAGRIIEYREVNGGFRRIEELKKVKGIGDETYNKIKNNICI